MAPRPLHPFQELHDTYFKAAKVFVHTGLSMRCSPQRYIMVPYVIYSIRVAPRLPRRFDITGGSVHVFQGLAGKDYYSLVR